jgi:hypothetical protein
MKINQNNKSELNITHRGENISRDKLFSKLIKKASKNTNHMFILTNSM